MFYLIKNRLSDLLTKSKQQNKHNHNLFFLISFIWQWIKTVTLQTATVLEIFAYVNMMSIHVHVYPRKCISTLVFSLASKGKESKVPSCC